MTDALIDNPTLNSPSAEPTRSRPFPPPSTGKIAVKVTDHHGHEVLKTHPIG